MKKINCFISRFFLSRNICKSKESFLNMNVEPMAQFNSVLQSERRNELECIISKNLDTALLEYYNALEKDSGLLFSGDITPEKSLIWDDLVSQIANLFVALVEQNCPRLQEEKSWN